MHPDEVDIDLALVRRLVAAQFPAWVGIAIEPVSSSGTDNALFRLGPDMAIRLPRLERAVGLLAKERRWLPYLAPQLPLEVPVPLAAGEPDESYPWDWSVYTWLEGSSMDREHATDLQQVAVALGRFVRALHAIDSAGGPGPGEHNFWRGEPLPARDLETRNAIAALGTAVNATAVTEAWEAALSAPAWHASPVWVHGDLLPGNLLTVAGSLSGVIDFGGLGVGDPACDLMAGWALFSGDSRRAFQTAVAVDDATWTRGRGWALSWALIFIPYYLHTNPRGVQIAQRTLEEVLADLRSIR